MAQFQTVRALYEEYAKVYCTYKSAIIIGPDHKLRSASYQNLPICMKVVSRQTYTYQDFEKEVKVWITKWLSKFWKKCIVFLGWECFSLTWTKFEFILNFTNCLLWLAVIRIMKSKPVDRFPSFDKNAFMRNL